MTNVQLEKIRLVSSIYDELEAIAEIGKQEEELTAGDYQGAIEAQGMKIMNKILDQLQN